MSSLRDAAAANAPLVLTIGGLFIGLIFGAMVAATNFCTLGALSDARTLGDTRRLKAWLLAIAVALVLTQGLAATGVVDMKRTMYLAPSLNWAGNLLGGLLFGFGMVFAGGCASRNITRVGGGDLRSLVTLLLIGLFAYMTIGGLFGPVRALLERSTSVDLGAAKIATQSLGDLVAKLAPGMLAPARANLIIALMLASLIAAYCFADGEFRRSLPNLSAGLGIGLLVAAGWALTGLAFDELSDRPVAPISLTYVRPTGDSIEWLGRFTIYE
jgi:uncharacterized membrane protein YedE/YeeE